MAHIAILGAGYMGSALTVPATDNGHSVALWGTPLDGRLVAAMRAGRRHPRLGLRLPRAVAPFSADELRAALAGADLVVNAVTSDAAVSVLRQAAPHISPGVPVLSVSKGLTRSRGRIVTLSTAVAEATGLRIVTVGGPSKAMELARRVPTAVMYASPDARARGRWRRALATSYYAITETADQRGLELCSALKNAYAIAVGLCDGLVEAGRAEAMYNTKSLIYTQAVAEIARLGRRARARPETVYGLGGLGDLHVTAVAGRNRIFGELRGAGLATRTVVRRLARRDQLTEGYAAIRWCWRFAAGRHVEVPLLRALHRIVYGGRDVERELRAACWTTRTNAQTTAHTTGGRR